MRVSSQGSKGRVSLTQLTTLDMTVHEEFLLPCRGHKAPGLDSLKAGSRSTTMTPWASGPSPA